MFLAIEEYPLVIVKDNKHDRQLIKKLTSEIVGTTSLCLVTILLSASENLNLFIIKTCKVQNNFFTY